MCGRYATSRSDTELADALGAAKIVGEEPGPSWNVAPTQLVRVALARAPREEPEADPVRQLCTVKWGLVPSWAKDVKIGTRMINARAETITSKNAFKAAARKRRCIVPADGYYEWQKNDDGTKTPFFLHADGDLVAMAGLYELWPDPAKREDDPDRWLWTCTILTTTATDALGHIHDRSPVVLPPGEMREAWLDPEMSKPEDVDALLASIPDPALVPREVSIAVNNPRNNSPDLIEPVHHS
ncbi:SOS response-associated peptidase [Allokutzneria albata]|uniref:Abasic site processing protein n=2 Tax=Allokutzneria albata TaxID=211114 RepID=A0A1G9SDE1_ALLAB|nr:SOS response-associated peptidase [Allokutzneria albata]SDM33498.1 Putative SOS response-associated peptidase YedK [Allokutzneria albata]